MLDFLKVGGRPFPQKFLFCSKKAFGMGLETHASDAAGAHNLSKYYMSASSPININAQIQKLRSLDHFEDDNFDHFYRKLPHVHITGIFLIKCYYATSTAAFSLVMPIHNFLEVFMFA